MKHSTLLVTLLSALWTCNGLHAQSSDTVGQLRETFSMDAPQPKNQSKLVVAFDRVSENTDGSQRHSRLLWNDGHWAGVGIHYCGMITNLSKMKLPNDAQYLSQSSKSIGVTLNPIDYTLLKSQHVGLITGLGVEFNNFRFDNNITLKTVHGAMQPDFQYEEQGITLSKSKLYTCYLNVPLVVEFQMGRHNNFFINLGAVGGWRMGTHTKIKASDMRLDGKSKDHSNFGLRNFHYGYTMAFGYRHFAITSTYYRSTLFKESKGPHIQQINVGISLML